ncbi:MAG: hypothetical protein EBS34_09835 [Flavobacteriales bacterium]|nr:hypothetical protein [Flavobacteriales bacterium]
MDFEQRKNSKDKLSQVISRWSNGNVNFVVEYDDNGNWKDGRMLTYYIDSQIKSNHYYKNGVIEGEGLYLKHQNSNISVATEKEFLGFLNE